MRDLGTAVECDIIFVISVRNLLVIRVEVLIKLFFPELNFIHLFSILAQLHFGQKLALVRFHVLNCLLKIFDYADITQCLQIILHK